MTTYKHQNTQPYGLIAAIIFTGVIISASTIFLGLQAFGGNKFPNGAEIAQELITALREEEQKANPQAAARAEQAKKAQATLSATSLDDIVDDDAFIGNANAPVTIVEFTDFQCPFCKKYHDQTFDQIKKEYIDKGLVKYVFRDYPLERIHPAARSAAIASECAQELGGNEAYLKYYKDLFEKQTSLRNSNVEELFISIAKESGLSVSSFESCLKSNRYDDEVSKDLQDGIRFGITGTPGFIINNKLIGGGARPFASFKQEIDTALAESK